MTLFARKPARLLLATALGVTAVLAVATSAAQARPAATNLSLVAYSTPAAAFSRQVPVNTCSRRCAKPVSNLAPVCGPAS